tara:strand:- start:110 stop:616 length:507 start_codon:yes stop_codon:yes gene_type:complete
MIVALIAASLTWSDQPQAVVRPGAPEDSAAAVAALAPNIPPAGGDWRVLQSTSEGATAIDVANIDEQGSLRTVWIAVAGWAPAGPPGSYALSRLELDCAAGTARPLWFAIRAPGGDLIYGFQPSGEPEAYDANSGGASIAATACHGEVLDGPGFPTHQAFAASVPTAP